MDVVESYDQAMDQLRDRTYAIAELITKRAATDDLASHRLWQEAMLCIGVFATLFALGLGRALGGRQSRPLRELRDAALAFGRGERLAFSSDGGGRDRRGSREPSTTWLPASKA